MAVKMWRPPEWEGINPKPIGTSMSRAFNREEMYKHGEKCADAMLKVLMDEGIVYYGQLDWLQDK